MCDRIRTHSCPQQQTDRALGSTYFCLPGDECQQGAGEALRNSSGGMRDTSLIISDLFRDVRAGTIIKG